MKSNKPRPIELLAPARNADIAITAIRHGADAVYIGAEEFGARAAATNTVEEIRRVAEYAHAFHAKVYVTLNTLIYDDELSKAEKLIRKLYLAGTDALIVQDLSLLKMDIPPIQLHASTQADARTPEKAYFLQQAGFSQIVLPREMTLSEISKVAAKVDVPLEVFVHGALCVSYSGACRASFLANGRSANRGDCAQMCRQSYTLEDSNGNALIRDKYLLSLKDMNRIAYLGQLMEAGASSFKIEGRLKDENYVKNVVAAYRRELDKIINANPDLYCRASAGETHFNFNPSLETAFNRGFTPYFLDTRQPSGIASLNTPKSIGIPIGRILHAKSNTITVETDTQISNGDGIGFFDTDGNFKGFRANRVEGNKIFLREAPPRMIPARTVLYRNHDMRRASEMARRDTATRLINTDASIRLLPDKRVCATFTAEGFPPAEVTLSVDSQQAKTPVPTGARERIIGKLGGTQFVLRKFTDLIPSDIFIPNSQLAALRRLAVEALVNTLNCRRKLCLPAARSLKAGIEGSETAENVANKLALMLYKELGSELIVPAAETLAREDLGKPDFTVMECRYCLRRELDACLRNPKSGRKLPSPLFIRTGVIRYRLDFNCSECMMKVIANPATTKN